MAGKSRAMMALLRLCFLKICKGTPCYYTSRGVKRLCFLRIQTRNLTGLTWLAPSFLREEHDGGDVAALALLHEAGAVAAELARVVFCDGVGAVVSDDVVDVVAQCFDSACFGEFAGFL